MHKLKILLVEDNNDIRLCARLFLERHYIVIDVATVEAGIACLKSDSFSLVITDLELPYEDVNDLITAVKALNADTPIILFSGSLEAYKVGKNLGVNATLLKGDSFERLLELTKTLLERIL